MIRAETYLKLLFTTEDVRIYVGDEYWIIAEDSPDLLKSIVRTALDRIAVPLENVITSLQP